MGGVGSYEKYLELELRSSGVSINKRRISQLFVRLPDFPLGLASLWQETWFLSLVANLNTNLPKVPPHPPKFKPLMKDNLQRGIERYVKKMLVSENFGLILKSQKYF